MFSQDIFNRECCDVWRWYRRCSSCVLIDMRIKVLESVKQHLDQTSTKRATQRSRFADKATPSPRKEREPSSSERVVSLSAYLAALFAALLHHPLFLAPPNPSFTLVLSPSLSVSRTYLPFLSRTSNMPERMFPCTKRGPELRRQRGDCDRNYNR